MSNLNYLLRMNDRSDLSASEYHKYLTDALHGWLLDLRHAHQDKVRYLEKLKDFVPITEHALNEDIRKTLRVLKDELGVER